MLLQLQLFLLCTRVQSAIPDPIPTLERCGENLGEVKNAPTGSEPIDFEKYNSLASHMNYYNSLDPSKAAVDIIGETQFGGDSRTEKNDILGITIPPTLKSKGMVIVCGIHAREWLSPELCAFVTQWAIEHLERKFPDLNLFIVPIMNVDGYAYTQSANGMRMWRINRNNTGECEGIDLNRNFKKGWEPQPSCGETWPGDDPQDQLEVQKVTEWILKLKENGSVDLGAFIDFHSHALDMRYAWGYKHEVDKFKEHQESVAQQAANAVKAVAGTNMPYNQGSEIARDLIHGGFKDWAHGEAGIECSFTIEMQNSQSFQPDECWIKQNDYEMTAALEKFLEAVRDGTCSNQGTIENIRSIRRNLSIFENRIKS